MSIPRQARSGLGNHKHRRKRKPRQPWQKTAEDGGTPKPATKSRARKLVLVKYDIGNPLADLTPMSESQTPNVFEPPMVEWSPSSQRKVQTVWSATCIDSQPSP